MFGKKYYPGSAAFFAADPDNYIVYNFSSQQLSILTKQNAYKYSQLSGIKSFELHLEDLLIGKDPLWNIKDYEKLLYSLIEKELLLPLNNSEVVKITKKNMSNSAIAVITCNRSELLANTLESISSELSEKKNMIPLIVFDDSTDHDTAEYNRKLTASINAKYKLKTLYFGIEEKKSFLRKLESEIIGKEINKDILNYVFFGNPELSILNGGGGNRNSALLKLAGKKIISFDDDTQFQFIEKVSTNKNIEITFENIPEVNLFGDIKKISKKYKKTEIDIINYIIDILGKDIHSLLRKTERSDKKLISENYRPNIGYSLETMDVSVKTVMLGIYGGKWYCSPFSIYMNTGEERNKSFKNKSEYLKIKENPVSLMLPECLTISKTPFLISTAFGIDTKEIPPPFPPQPRADDNIWIAIMHALNNNAFISHLPFAVYHEMENKQPFHQKDYEDTTAGSGLMTVLIIHHIQKSQLSIFPKISYENLANQLIELSRLNDNDFTLFCHDLWLEYTCSIISQLENLLVKYRSKPKRWATDIRDYIALFEKQSINPHNSLPREFRNNYTISESIKLYKLFLKDYGELIKCWPAIWDAAIKVNKQGF